MKKKSYLPPELPSDDFSFDALEAKIRGEEVLNREEAHREKEERAIAKALKEQEVERRLRELKEKKQPQKHKDTKK